MAEIVNTADLTPDAALDSDTALWLYNGLDASVTYEILDTQLPMLDNISSTTYAFSRELQAPVLEMMQRGLAVNHVRKHSVLAEMRGKMQVLEAQLTSLIEDGVGVKNVNWRSPAQLNNLLYDVMGLPEVKKRNANGQWARTSNREAIEKLSGYFIAEPICNHLMLLRDLGKSIGFLETGLDSDGRMRSNINIAGTITGRFASSISDFGTGCVKPTAEALTPRGWEELGSLQDGDLIAQYNKGVIEFVPATFHWQPFSGTMLRFKSEQVDLTVTPGHRMLVSDYKGNITTDHAAKIIQRKQNRVPLSGLNRSGTKEVPAYLAMLMADCSKEGTIWRGAWTKERKIKRVAMLLKEAGIEYKLQKGNPGYVRLNIYADINLPKKYGPWVLELTQKSAYALVREAAHWDSHIRGNSFIFYTADEKEAEWFQILCHLTNHSTTLRSQRNSDEAYGNNSIIYCVNVKPRTAAQILRRHWNTVSHNGVVGCPTVPSSYWLVRENGFISVTGNTNLQNVTPALRSVFVADPGYKLGNLDLEQADARNLGALAWNELVTRPDWTEHSAGKYLDFCESGDLHTNVAKMANQALPWGSAPDREIADRIAYRDKSYRFLAKTLGHGTNFYGQPPTMARHAKLPVSMVKEFQDAYFALFPCIPAWHESIRYALLHGAQLTTPFNRRRYFFGRPKDATTLREAIAHQPQSMTGDEINTGILRLWRANRVQLLMQVHDSILFQYPEELEDEIIPWALETLKTHLVLAKGRDFCVPTEAMTGWNWGYHSEENVDGLKKWKGTDDRKRTETRFKLSILDR